MDSREGSDSTVRERVRERAHSDHYEELQAVVFECKGEGSEARVVCEKSVDHGFQNGSGEEEGGGATDNGTGGGDEPSRVLMSVSKSSSRRSVNTSRRTRLESRIQNQLLSKASSIQLMVGMIQ